MGGFSLDAVGRYMLSLLRKDSQHYINRGFDGKETNVTGDAKALSGKSICHGLYTHLNTRGKRSEQIQTFAQIFRTLNNEAEIDVNVSMSMSTLFAILSLIIREVLDAVIGSNQVGVPILWNGEGCVLRCLFKEAQATYS